MKILLNYFVIFLFLFISAVFLTNISLFVINNPDEYNYLQIMNSSTGISFAIEPTVYFFSESARFFSDFFELEPIFFFYFQYIFIIQFFLIFAFLNFFKKSFFISYTLLLIWLLTYGLMHGIIQIRFGLASCIFFFLYSLFYRHSDDVKLMFLAYIPFGLLAFFSHYSSILSILSLFVIWYRNSFKNIDSGKVAHIIFIMVLLAFKFGYILNFLPEFLVARIGIYINSDDYEPVSNITILFSILCYILLIISPNLKSKKLNSLRIYGALGFIPYFITPELEILVRLGIPFQYLLLPYLFLTISYKRVFFFSTIPLLLFYLYKIYSSAKAFIGYLN
jgi:hypothetical protein